MKRHTATSINKWFEYKWVAGFGHVTNFIKENLNKLLSVILNTIKKKLVLTFLFLIILPITFSSVISYIIIQDIVKDKTNIGNKTAVSQACINIERIFRDMIIASNTLILDDKILDILNHPQTEDLTQLYANYSKINDRFYLVQTSTLDSYNPNIIAVLDQSSNVYSTRPNSTEEDTLFRNILSDQKINTNGNYIKWAEKTYSIQMTYSKKKNDFIIMLRAYMDVATGKKRGDTILAISEMEFSKILQRLVVVNGIKAYIVNDSGEILSSTDLNELGEQLELYKYIKENGSESIDTVEFENERYIINSQKLAHSGWSVVQIIPGNILFSEISSMRNMIIGINLAFLLVFFGVSYLIAKSISSPINRLSAASKEIAAGNLQTRVSVTGRDEMAQLSVNFNNMAEEIGELIKRNKEDEKTKRELELQMLYAQINPHFLFNTLNSIRWMADASKVFNVSKIIIALVNLLKNSIIKKNEYISIREEIENVKNYIYIQKIRYMSIFEGEYDIEESILECKTIKLVLQPIVENSIIHGFEGISHKGIIKIKAYRDGDNIKLTVSDNGVGMNEEQLKKLLCGDVDKRGYLSGIGISNVNERLILHFGSNYALNIKSAPGEGSTTEINIPLMDSEENNV